MWFNLVGRFQESDNAGSTGLDNILSFAIPGLIVIEAIAPLSDLINRWVTTSSSPLQAVSASLNRAYLDTFCPVISSRTLGHVAFVARDKTVVGGRRVACPFECKDGINVSNIKKLGGGRIGYRVTCKGCKRFKNLIVTADDVEVGGDKDSRYEFVVGGHVVQTSFPVPIQLGGWLDQPSQEQSGRPTKRARTCTSPCGHFSLPLIRRQNIPGGCWYGSLAGTFHLPLLVHFCYHCSLVSFSSSTKLSLGQAPLKVVARRPVLPM